MLRTTHLALAFAMLATLALAGCKSASDTSTESATASNESPGWTLPWSHDRIWSLPAGTPVHVRLDNTISSETATAGETWDGVVTRTIELEGHVAVPAGSAASGVVVAVNPASRGERAMLDLGLRSFTVGAKTFHVRGRTESIVAGSTRARNLGAIAGATVAGAVIGHAIGGSGRGTALGALIGGGAATGVVAKSRGYQVVLRPGTPLTFTTDEAVAMRR